MTIHADFFKIVKEGCGHAFTDTPPVAPDVVFIDGQVKLMKADAITSWELFFSIQFYKTIERCFALGAHTVVLGFDDYEHVPSSKAMTQAKRAKQRVDYECAQTSALPSRPPEDRGSAMANRTFKVKVLSRVLEVTRAWFEQKLKTDARFANWTLVLDHRGVVTVLEKEGDACFELTCPTCGAPEFVEHLLGVGEEYVPHGSGFPYYDHGLGLEVQSPDHRRRVMKERGLVCMEGEAEREFDRARAEHNAARERLAARQAEDAARQQRDPEIRKAQARVAGLASGHHRILEADEGIENHQRAGLQCR
jgi:hypothetical protein